MRIGVLTAGGDCPGVNAVIRAAVRKGERHHDDLIFGFMNGYRGLIEDDWQLLDVDALRGTLPRGGTIIGTRPIAGTLDIGPQTYDEYGHVRLGGIGSVVAGEIEVRTGYETRVTILGYVQRGGTPTPFDRVLSSRYGVAAIDAVHDHAWGQMVALQSNEILRVPLADAVAEIKPVSQELRAVAREFFA